MVVNFVCTNYNHLGNLKIYVQAPSQTIQLKSLNQILYITHTHTHTHTQRDSLVAQMVKSLPAMWETRVPSLGQKDPLEKEMATHSVFLPGKSHGWRSLTCYSP